jgi:hypothetical protein
MDEQKRDVMHPWSPESPEVPPDQSDADIYNQPIDAEKGIKRQSDQFKEDVRHLREQNLTPEGEESIP